MSSQLALHGSDESGKEAVYSPKMRGEVFWMNIMDRGNFNRGIPFKGATGVKLEDIGDQLAVSLLHRKRA